MQLKTSRSDHGDRRQDQAFGAHEPPRIRPAERAATRRGPAINRAARSWRRGRSGSARWRPVERGAHGKAPVASVTSCAGRIACAQPSDGSWPSGLQRRIADMSRPLRSASRSRNSWASRRPRRRSRAALRRSCRCASPAHLDEQQAPASGACSPQTTHPASVASAFAASASGSRTSMMSSTEGGGDGGRGTTSSDATRAPSIGVRSGDVAEPAS